MSDLGQVICEAMGLDPAKVEAVSLLCEVGRAPRLKVYMVVGGEALGLSVELKQYKLVPVDEDEED